jgi:hypothetical protein
MSPDDVPIEQKKGGKIISDMLIEIQIMICGYALPRLPSRVISIRDESTNDSDLSIRFITCRPYHYFGGCHEACGEILVVRKEGEKLVCIIIAIEPYKCYKAHVVVDVGGTSQPSRCAVV